MAYKRFVDDVNSKKLIYKCADFSFRSYGLPSRAVIYAFLSLLIVNVIIINDLCFDLILSGNDISSISTNRLLLTLVVLILITVGAAIFSYSMIHRVKDILLHSEFQSMVFANAMAVDASFTIVINKQENILYYDAHAAYIFNAGDDGSFALQNIVSHIGFDNNDVKNITSAIKKNHYFEAVFLLKKGQIDEQRLKIMIEPLKRPEGFSIIRGYKT